MIRLIEKIKAFMEGRYRGDELNIVILACAVTVGIAAAIVSVFGNIWAAIALWLLWGGLLALATWRALSKNVHMRMAANRKYLSVKEGFLDFFSLQFHRIKDRKTHIYKRCPACKTVLRLPRKPGEHGVTCGKCGHKFRATVKEWKYL